MKKYITIFILIASIIACKSSSKKLEKGDYDSAMNISAKKIMKDPGKFEEVDVFNDAYRLANAKDITEINQLKQIGDPANWSKIFFLYSNLIRRQELASKLPPVGINYDKTDYSKDIENARNQATVYAFEKGSELLLTNNRFDARKAFNLFVEAKKFTPNYPLVDEKIAEAKYFGTTNVFFRIENNANIVAPQAMMDNVQNINVDDLDANWLNYDSYIDTTILYHYSIILNMEQIAVSPEELKETVSSESKEIPDGFDYVLDANGNVKKDSLGNDIKITKYKTISCTVKRYQQRKAAKISGTLNYYDNLTSSLIKSEPIVSEAFFENFYGLAFGDLAALSPETQKQLNANRPLPFPPSEALIIQAGEVLKAMTKDIIVKNKGIVK
ncbi:MAG: hypothetical protein K0B10_05575 [Vicingaceae bacterium]|nr:hypothetical protein [Vicingaceae bacterium]